MNDAGRFRQSEAGQACHVRSLLVNVLSGLEHELYQIGSIRDPFLRKRALMKNLCTAKILVARYLVLYRWLKSSQILKSIDKSQESYETNLQITSSRFNKMAKEILLGNNGKILEDTINITENSFNSNEILLPRRVDVDLFLKRRPARITSVILRYGFIKCIAGQEYSFTIKYNCYDIKLHSLRCSVPKDSGCFGHRMKNLTAKCKYIVKNSQNIFIDLDTVIHEFCMISHFISIARCLKQYQDRFPFFISAWERGVALKFPCKVSPNVIITFSLELSSIVIMSQSLIRIPPWINTDNKTKTCFYSKSIKNSLDDIHSVLTEITEIVFYTQLYKLNERIENSLRKLAIFDLTTRFDGRKILFFFSKMNVFRVAIDQRTGELAIDIYNQQLINKEMVYLAMTSVSNTQTELISEIYFTYITNVVLEHIYGTKSYAHGVHRISLFKEIHETIFCFATQYRIKCHGPYYNPVITIMTPDNEELMSHEAFITYSIEKILTVDKLKLIFYSTKIEVLILKLINNLKSNSIQHYRVGNKIIMNLNPFQVAVLKIGEFENWSVKFMRADVGFGSDFSFKIVGRELTLRFTEWLIFVMSKVCSIMMMLKQTMGIVNMNQLDLNVYKKNRLNYVITVNVKNCLCKPVTLGLSCVEYDHMDLEGNEVFVINRSFSCTLGCAFFKQIQTKRHSSTIPNVRRMKPTSPNLGSFFISSLLAFQVFHETFGRDLNNTNWSHSMFRPDVSFFLVYKNKYSLNVMLQPPHSFQIVVPTGGASRLLQIPMNKIFPVMYQPDYRPIPLVIYMTELKSFKETIEEFFLDYKIFEERRLCNVKVIPINPKRPFGIPRIVAETDPAKSQLKIGVQLNANGIDLNTSLLDPNTPLAHAFLTLANLNVKGKSAKRILLKFCLGLIRLPQNFAKDLLVLLEDLITAPQQLVDWQRTIEDECCVNEIDRKVTLSLVTSIGNFFIEVKYQPDEALVFSATGLLPKVKKMSDLKKWLASLRLDIGTEDYYV